MRNIDTLIVDKTGTLTECMPRLVAMLPEQGHDEAEVLPEDKARTATRSHQVYDHRQPDG